MNIITRASVKERIHVEQIIRSAQPYSGIDVDVIQYHSDGSFAKRTLRSIFSMTPVQYELWLRYGNNVDFTNNR